MIQTILTILCGCMIGFLIGEIIFYRPMYEHYKQVADEYCEKWFSLHKHACEAWHLLKKKDYERALFELDMYYGDEK